MTQRAPSQKICPDCGIGEVLETGEHVIIMCRLHAAAPDLLAALLNIVMYTTGGWQADPEAWMDSIRDTAEVAIAKATSPQAQ